MAQIDYPAILEEAWTQHLVLKAANAPTVVSLFAGCGGSSLGYSMAGFRELLAVEWDDNAVQTFKLNFPDVPVYHDDIHDLTVEQCLKMAGLQVGELDVLDGSPPCQGFSTAGKRQIDDARNQLAFEFVRLLRGLQPKVFVMENVSGLVKGKMKLVFAEIMKALKASKYQVRCKLLNAKYFQVPQNRKRLIWIGIRKSLNIEPSHPTAQTKSISVKEAIGDLSEMQDASIDHIWIDESSADRNTQTYQLALRTRQGQKYAGHQRRAVWDDVFPTITKSSKEGMNIPPYLRNSHCHPIWTRTFSVRENARAMSFPDGFQFVGAQVDKQSRIGNSVPPLMMRAIAQHIRQEILTQ